MKRDSTNAPDNFIFAGSGDGGVAEIIKVGADFGLNADSTNTVLRSIIEAEMGGKFFSWVVGLITSKAKIY